MESVETEHEGETLGSGSAADSGRTAKAPEGATRFDERRRIAELAAGLVDSGFHCSEGLIYAVGERILDPLPAELVRAGTGFGGGIGGTQVGYCGALIAALMLIGAVHGRTDARAPDEPAYRLSAAYLEVFRETFGATHCDALLRLGYGTEENPCSGLVGRAAWLLMGLLEAD